MKFIVGGLLLYVIIGIVTCGFVNEEIDRKIEKSERKIRRIDYIEYIVLISIFWPVTMTICVSYYIFKPMIYALYNIGKDLYKFFNKEN